MTPEFKNISEKKLIGQCVIMSIANNRTYELWNNFAPRIKEIKDRINSFTYSVEIYPHTEFFEKFDPAAEFEKWAAIEVSDFEAIPEGMDNLTLSAGLYAVFHYRGKPSDAMQTFRYIFGEWLPKSEYQLDNRPHFALMGEKYKGEHPDSEEEFWIPVSKK